MAMLENRFHPPIDVPRRLRRHVLTMIHAAGSGHCGGALSVVEILTVLYFGKMHIDSGWPDWPDRDRFIASKGHCAPALYAALALRGFFPEAELPRLRQLGHFLQGHPDMRKVPGVDFSTGSLGLGLSAGIGMSLAGRLDGKTFQTYVLLGCGEHQEGQIWEAAMAAAKYRLHRLTAIVDYNEVQLDGKLCDIMPLGNLADKWRTFGWYVIETDGHDLAALSVAVDEARNHAGGPAVIIARTVKGKGISFMEHRHEWHGKPLDDATYRQALAELEAAGHG